MQVQHVMLILAALNRGIQMPMLHVWRLSPAIQVVRHTRHMMYMT